MDQSPTGRPSVGSNWVPMKTNCVSLITGWTVALATVLVQLLLGQAFGAELQIPPSAQPDQMWSKVDYDPKFTDPFFKSNEWSYPWWIIEHPDGHFESTRSEDESPVKDPPRLKHTAKCFSTSFGEKHLIKICEAKLLDANAIDLFIHEDNASFIEDLKVQIKHGMFTCEYYGLCDIPSAKGLVSTTKRQELTLDKKVYQKGDVIKGKIDFEWVEEVTDPEYVEKYGRNPITITIKGVFKTILE